MKLAKRQVIMWFSLGLVAGALIICAVGRCRWGHRRPKPGPEDVIQHFSEGLNLDDSQHQKLREIILTHHPKFETLRREAREKRSRLFDSVQSQIKDILNPDQQALFDQRIERHEKRRKRRPRP